MYEVFDGFLTMFFFHGTFEQLLACKFAIVIIKF